MKTKKVYYIGRVTNEMPCIKDLSVAPTPIDIELLGQGSVPITFPSAKAASAVLSYLKSLGPSEFYEFKIFSGSVTEQ